MEAGPALIRFAITSFFHIKSDHARGGFKQIRFVRTLKCGWVTGGGKSPKLLVNIHMIFYGIFDFSEYINFYEKCQN